MMENCISDRPAFRTREDSARPEAAVNAELQRAGKEVSDLQEICSILHERLAPVLGDGTPKATNGKGECAERKCQLAEKIGEVREGIHSARSTIESLLDRLEL